MIINKDKNFCYRICHVANIAHVLKNGMCTKNHPNASDEFVTIGNQEIIDFRDNTRVKLARFGNIGDYVPFYFTPKSMMLFNIITGFRAPLVPKRNREELIVIRCLIEKLAELEHYFFTDGQANVTSITEHYSDLRFLSNIDWKIIQEADFKKAAEDTDKQRRYQAEFLVRHHVPANYIESINVYTKKVANFVREAIAQTDLLIPVHVVPQYFFDPSIC